MQAFYLQTQDMTVGYDKPLIEHIDLRLRRGEIMTLIGPNGAGKSTILKTIVRQLRLLGGVVELDGQSLASLDNKTVAQKMSVLMTERHQPELMTCRDVAAAGRYPYTGRLGLLSEKDQRAVDQALELVHGTDLGDRPFDRISDGQRQRIMLARALCQEPEMILLDEPTSHLDVKYKLEFLSLLREMARKKELSVIMSLHELDLAERISDRVVCIKDGRMDRCGTPEEIFSGGYIRRLYGVERGSYCESFGCPELEPIRGAPQIFVIGGNGTGIPVYRRLQRQGVPFAAGILPENDVDHPVASALAVEVIAQRAYHPIGEDTFQRALSVLERCSQVLCCLREFGPLNEANRRLAQAGGDRTVYLDDQPKPKPDFCQ